jgi:hypothetical protein
MDKISRRAFISTGPSVVATLTLPTMAGASTGELEAKLQRYRIANAEWYATGDAVGEITSEGPAYEAAWQACKDVVFHPCSSATEVARKIEIILADRWLEETAQVGYDDGRYLFRDFARSLIVPTT